MYVCRATQLLTWFLIPMSQGFSDAGDFTFLGRYVHVLYSNVLQETAQLGNGEHILKHGNICCRLMSSLKQNLTYYLSIALAGLIGIGVLLISGSLHAGDLIPLAMLLSNTYGTSMISSCTLKPVLYPAMHWCWCIRTRTMRSSCASGAGLVAVMLLLGFGLVHIPRTMLREADPASRLHYAYYKYEIVFLQLNSLA